VVLVNSGTASAAEIVSGAIQDHDAGLVVGSPTWGKGLVQTVYNLAYGAGLALTTAKYYTPSGRLIQRDYHSYFDYYTRADVEPQVGGERPPPSPEETFATDLGRKVYGGGGITPDVEVEPTELDPYLQFLLARAAFFNFGVDFEARHPEVDRDWRPGPGLLDEFRAWLIAQKIDSAADVTAGLIDETHRAFAERQIRAEVMAAKYGIEAQHPVLAEGDLQIQAALSLFGRASELLAQRAERGDLPRVAPSDDVRN
jgi:carboxyl-terminal processing protease